MPSISSSPQARRGPRRWVSTGYSGDGTTHDQFTGAGSFCILIRVPSDSNDTVHAYILYDRTHRCAQQLQHQHTTMIMHVAQDAARSALKQRRGSGEGVVVLGI